MAAFDLQEQEQIAELKAWWARWGKLCMAGGAALIVGYLGQYGWQAYQKSQAQAAASSFALVERAFQTKDAAKTRSAADAMVRDRADHALTARAMLLSAKLAFDAGQSNEAKTALQWVVDHSKEDAVVDVATLRLSALLLDLKQFEQALKLVEKPRAEAFAGQFLEARADILTEKGDKAAAKKAYQDALNKLGSAGQSEKEAPAKQLIEIKLAALGV